MKMKKPKRNFIILSRMFNYGLHNIVRNVWLTTAATAVMTVTLAIMLFSTVANTALTETINDRTTDFTVSIYIQPSPDQTILDSLEADLESREYVESVSYISETQAVQNFIDREQNEAIRDAIELSGQPLPSSYEVSLNDLSQVDSIIEIANNDLYATIFDRTGQTDVTKRSAEQYLSIQESVNKVSLIAGNLWRDICINYL